MYDKLLHGIRCCSGDNTVLISYDTTYHTSSGALHKKI